MLIVSESPGETACRTAPVLASSKLIEVISGPAVTGVAVGAMVGVLVGPVWVAVGMAVGPVGVVVGVLGVAVAAGWLTISSPKETAVPAVPPPQLPLNGDNTKS